MPETSADRQIPAVLVEEFYAISVERRITYPCVAAISDAAMGKLFGAQSVRHRRLARKRR